MHIGPYLLRNPFILAPMAGVSEMPFRRIALRLGAALAPTELVSAAGLVHASARTLKYLRRDPSEHPFVVQVFGGDPEQLGAASVIARDRGADVIDVNMGCPVQKVTKNGAGSALLCDPERAGSVVSSIRRHTGLPVTVKIRAGWDASRINCVEVGLALQGAGASAVAIHPRTRAQGYSGFADWRLIASLKAALTIPVIGNGDVKTPGDAQRMMRETGCDAVMVGRAALGNPWIFRELLDGEPPSAAERRDLVLEHFDAQLSFVGDVRRGVHQFRKHLLWYARGLRSASSFRTRACVLEDPKEVREVIQDFFNGAERDGSHAEPEVDYRAALG
jgi:tRNA-dihydrouridine synthase B